MIHHSSTHISETDIASCIDQLRSGIINDSSKTRELEEFLYKYIGGISANATSTGTLALIMAMRGVGVKEGDYILTSTYVCEDIRDAILYLKANPVYLDIDELDYNISPVDARNKIRQLQNLGISAKAMIIPHMFGVPADMESLLKLGIPIIEDCCHSVGCTLNHTMTGNFGIASIFSFHALKYVVSGEGGAVVWNKPPSKEAFILDYHLSNILYAICLSQFSRINEIHDKRREIALLYDDEIRNSSKLSGFQLPQFTRGEGALLRYCVKLPDGVEIDQFKSRMETLGVIVQRPVKTLNHLLDKKNTYECPVSEKVFQRIISLPAHLNIAREDVLTVVKSMESSIDTNQKI